MLGQGKNGRTPSAADPLNKRYNSDDWKDDPELDKLPGVGRHRAFLPVSVDLSDRMPRPGDQGDMGACAAWSK